MLILEVIEGNAAEAAGLRGTVFGANEVRQYGDIIQRLGDDEIANMNDLLGALEQHSVGETVTIEFYRDGRPQVAQVQLQ